MRIALLLVLAVGCSSSDGACNAPSQTTYKCHPLPAGASGCVGGPSWHSDYDQAEHHDDPDKVFPVDCQAVIPECDPLYPGSARTFTCDGGEPNGWSELL
jgi:hypothetical protein